MSLPENGGDGGASAASGTGGGGQPREGSREIDEGIIVSVPFDWCKSPTAPVPYTIWARQKEAANLANSVRQTDDRSHAKDSIVLQCYGDEGGTGGGVISGTHNAECTPKTWSATVRAEGRNMVRHDDEWWMNHKNTWGKLTYVKDMSLHSTPAVPQIVPDMGVLPREADQYLAQANNGTASASAVAIPAYGGSTTAGGGAVAGGEGAAGTAEGIGIGAGAATVGLAAGMLLLMTTSTAKDDVVRVSGGCKLIPYKNNQCPKGSQAHHVVADRSMNLPTGRLLSKGDGLTLCLKGNAFPRTLLTGHAVAQSGYDLGARARAANSPDGKLSLDQAENIGATSAAAGAAADGRNCNPAGFKIQLRAYHAAHNLPGSTRVRP